MKKFVVLVIFYIFSLMVHAQKMQALFSYCSFFSPEQGPFFETYLSVDGNSVKFVKNDNGKYQGIIEITMIFKQGDTIRKFSRYDLYSPEKDDTLDLNFQFIDQQRYPLKNGEYGLNVFIRDKNRNEEGYRAFIPVSVNYPVDKACLSGIELVESYKKTEETNILSKSGYDLIPYMTDFYPETSSKLIFYCEVYNTHKIQGEGSRFLLSYWIESFESGKPFNEMIVNSRESGREVIPLLREFDISKLPSGNYNLVVSLKDQQNQEIASDKIFFQRSNPSVEYDLTSVSVINVNETFISSVTRIDSMQYYIKSLKPISTQLEVQYAQTLLKNKEMLPMQQYFYNFWNSRNNIHPEQEWKTYLTNVKMVEETFGTKIKRGFESDRGRIYLKYGSPNTITDVPYETSSLDGEGTVPYQIWHFYNIPKQGSRKFVFYCPELSTNDYELIHSDAIGEISNYNWQSLIRYRKKGSKLGDPPFGNQPENYDGKSGEYYKIPR